MGKFAEMKNQELFEYVEKYVAEKIKKNSDEVRYSYFELKIKLDMNKDEIDRFLKCSRIILEEQRLQSLFYRFKV